MSEKEYILGKLLRDLRGDKTLREIAQLSGNRISHNQLSILEKGLRDGKQVAPKPETLEILSEVYNYPYMALMEAAGYVPDEQSDEDKEYETDFVTLEEWLRQVEEGRLKQPSGEPYDKDTVDMLRVVVKNAMKQQK